jgi:uncharacterized protein YyaL (SSP411 family)
VREGDDTAETKRSLTLLDKWVSTNGWYGYDPYDIKGKRLFLPLQKSKYTDFLFSRSVERFPMLTRKIFGVKKEINAKAMALFARAYINLYKIGKNKEWLNKALSALNWLEENYSKGYSGFCWGYPFDWQSKVFIPKGTPSGVVTSTAAHAFLDAYEQLGDRKYLEIAESCCAFILNDLNIDRVEENMICFSYTPIDTFHVHNANLFSASTLIRTYKHSKNKEYKVVAEKAINFTMDHQRENGSWYYWAPPDRVLEKVDNYHTGFVLECLNVYRRAMGKDFRYNYELKKGLDFYAKNLFLEDGTPKMTHESTYPIDIHSCTQGIITFCELADFDPNYLKLAKKIAEWTINNMQDDSGSFYYRIYKKGYVDKMPYIRWGQAWMLRALSYLVPI